MVSDGLTRRTETSAKTPLSVAGTSLSLWSLISKKLNWDSLHDSPRVPNSKRGEAPVCNPTVCVFLRPFYIHAIVKASHSQTEIQGMEEQTLQLPVKYCQHFFSLAHLALWL